MSSTQMHWAARYIGKAWARHGRGPREFSCWGLVMWVCADRLDIRMPEIATETDESQILAIFDAVRAGDWEKTSGAPRENDIVLMRNPQGDRHCGYMVHDGRRLGVLHADGHATPQGPVGYVVFQDLDAACAGGYTDLEFWRHGQ